MVGITHSFRLGMRGLLLDEAEPGEVEPLMMMRKMKIDVFVFLIKQVLFLFGVYALRFYYV